MVRENWLGNPVKFGKPYNVFRTGSETQPAKLFKDNDRDGVPNVFDCQPNNPRKQGILDAIIGGVKGVFSGGSGSIKRGFQEGMAKSGNVVSRRYAQYREGVRNEKIRRFASSPQEKIRTSLPGQPSSYEAYQAREAERKKPSIVSMAGTKIAGAVQNRFSRLQRRIVLSHPQARKAQLASQIRNTQMAIDKSNVARGASQKRTLYEGLRTAFPMIPSQAMPSETAYQGKTGQQGRGKPKGSHVYPGGVYEYRKLLRAQKAAAKYQSMLQRSRALQTMPQMMAARQAQLQQQQMQVPQEAAGASADYSQFPGYEQQVQQIPQQQMQMQQYPQQQQMLSMPQPSQREVVPVFKSSGGHPYPVVDRTPLAPTNQTIPQGFVETVDSFTGRKFYKKLPQAEAWVR